MTDYTKTEDYAAKDSLPTGDSDKVVTGQELDLEFTNIQTAVNSKIDDPASKNADDYLQWNGSAWVASAVSASTAVPVGSIIPYGGGGDTGDFLLCDGRLLSQTTYATLFAVIGTFYGSGAGTFALPDLRGRTLVGSDDWATGQGDASRLTNAIFATGGRTLVGSTGGQDAITTVPGHSHTAGTLAVGGSASVTGTYTHPDDSTAPGAQSVRSVASATGNVDPTILGISLAGLTVTGSTASAGVAAVDVMNPMQLITFLIKYQ